MAIIMKKEIYRYIGMVAVALGFVACANDNGEAPSIDGSKTPIDIAVAFVNGETVSKSTTRAVDKTFEANDKLVAHLQHVQGTGSDASLVGSYEKTITLTMNSNVTMSNTSDENIKQTTSFTTSESLYWDDFSDATKDIRTEGHGLRSAWGYCYNGNSSAPTEGNHKDDLEWSVSTSQNTDNNFKTSDLLWSQEQTPVPYNHEKKNHGTIIIPYTHAMSKATIVLTAGEGFGDDAFKNTTITLKSVNIKGKFTASTATVVGTKTGEEGQYETGYIQMQKKSTDATNNSVTFECVFVPNTLLNDGKLWAEINNVAGNNYKIKLTSAMLATEKWGAGPTKSGVNYKLAATISKQKIDVVAQIADWIYKETSADGKIQFSTDLTNITSTGDLSAGSYLVFMSDTDNDTNYGDAATTRSYSENCWQDSPTLYWQGEGEARFFRGLAKMNGECLSSEGVSRNAEQGTDLLWATTPQHTGKDNSGNDKTYQAGEKIDPRTSFVPLKFEHAMSKVKFVLKTTDDENTKVNLEGVTMSIPGITTNGTIDVANGNITIGSTEAYLAPVDNKEYIVIPQKLEGKKLTITLNDANADGQKTTYSILLTDCKVDGNAILSWERGNSYEYTITLAKEAIQFRALIKDWNKKTGSGDASLDWD